MESMKQIPVEIFTYSKPLFESIYSTKEVNRKTIRHMIQAMKDSLSQGEVQDFHWIETIKMLADIHTKDSTDSDMIKKVLEEGKLKVAIGKKAKQEVGEEYEPLALASIHLVSQLSI